MNKESFLQSVPSSFISSQFYQTGATSAGIPLTKGIPGVWEIIQLQF